MKSSWAALLLTLLGIAGLAALGPAEMSLGSSVRVVYLHGVWVWAALAGFAAAAVTGLAGLVLQAISPDSPGAPARRSRSPAAWQRLSLALGRTGLLFWITYLPISMWAMQANWNGLFLAEPRWRLAVIFALGGLLLQIGILLVDDLRWAAAANLVFFAALVLALAMAENVMHPPAPILRSDAPRIQAFFGGLLALTLLAAAQVARLWLRFDRSRVEA